ncbi:AAA family ATPase [Cardinium endosymbiont of Tipula unca]|uniref:AAA family ATPase n=1 Tax=Cardinium endosymbiont of Tipula unca TaxID=3066216 RepID=UPI0030D2550C
MIKLESYAKQIVFLLDEYDAPFINIKEGNLQVVRDFLTVLKGLDKKIHLEFVTGVSAYCFKDLISGPNNLRDLTLDPSYATVADYKEEDLLKEQSFYKQKINCLASKKSLPTNVLVEHMRFMYNGYIFSTDPNALSVYNPWSTLNFLNTGEFGN